MHRGRTLATCLSWVLLLAAASCSRSGRSRDVSFQVAAPAGGASCDQLMAVPDPCVTVQAYDHVTGEPLPLVRPDDPERRQVFKLRFEGASVTPRWDVQVAEGQRLDLRVVVYDNDAGPRFGAFVEDVDLTSDEVTIRLYPFRSWACPGTGASPRALHGAVPLGADRVLIFGGVFGSDLDPLSARDPRAHGGALPVETVELYDGRTHRFSTLRVHAFDGATAFRRVLFDAALIGEERAEAGRTLYRVRVIGGFTGPSGSPLLHFDNVGTRGASGSPFVPSATAEVGPTVDLVVDPAAGTVEIEDAEFSTPVPKGGLVTLSPHHGSGQPEDPALVLLGLGREGEGYQPSDLVFSFTREGVAADVRSLVIPRLGATPLSVPAGFLIWGGGVGGSVGTDEAGAEFLPPEGGEGVPVRTGAGLPPPTAFHSATPVGPASALVAGGYLVEAMGLVLGSPPPEPLYYLEADEAAPPSLAVRPVSTPAGYVDTIYHTATPLPGLGVALVGGAGPDGGNRLAPQGQAGVVIGMGYEPVEPLRVPRWGHTATPLSGHRLLVVGGFARDEGSSVLNALVGTDVAEVFYWDAPPPGLAMGECAADMEGRDDGGSAGMDAGLPPRPDAGVEGGVGGADGGSPPPSDGGSPDGDGGAGVSSDGG